jgi:hypothetical protein
LECNRGNIAGIGDGSRCGTRVVEYSKDVVTNGGGLSYDNGDGKKVQLLEGKEDKDDY